MSNDIHIRHDYDSLSDMLDDADRKADPENGSAKLGKSWRDLEPYDKVIDLGRNGWDDAPRLIEPTKLDRPPLGNSAGYSVRRKYGPVGKLPDIPRVLAGIPDCMVSFSQRRTPTPVRLVYRSCHACSRGGEDIARQGTVILTIAEQLSSIGIPVEIISLIITGTSDKKWVSTVLVKPEGKPFSRRQLAFPLVHQGMLRRIGFALMEGEDQATRRWFGFKRSGGYGMTPDKEFHEEYVRDNLSSERQKIITFFEHSTSDVDRYYATKRTEVMKILGVKEKVA